MKFNSLHETDTASFMQNQIVYAKKYILVDVAQPMQNLPGQFDFKMLLELFFFLAEMPCIACL